MNKDHARYEIADLLGDIEDSELEYYQLMKQRLSSGINFIVSLQDIKFDSTVTLGELLQHNFNYISNKGASPKYTRLRNNLQKHFLYSDEEYEIEIFFEEMSLIKDKINESHWELLKNLKILSLGQWDFNKKVNLRYGFFRVFIKLLSPFGNLRIQHEQEDKILDTEAYTKFLFYTKVIKILKLDRYNHWRYRPSDKMDPMLEERKQLWSCEINFQHAHAIPFNLFGAKNAIEYWEFVNLFFEVRYNYKMLEKGQFLAGAYHKQMQEYYKGLNSSGVVFLKVPSYYHKQLTRWQRIKRWIKILKK